MNSRVAIAHTVAERPEDLADDALRRLADFAPRIRRIVGGLNEVEWFSRLGLTSDFDGGARGMRSLRRGAKRRVKPVEDMRSALALRRDEVSVDDRIWTLLAELGKEQNLLDAMVAAEDYWIAAFDFDMGSAQVGQDTIDELLPFVRSDIVGSLRETVLGDGIGVYYFSDALFWYRKGHMRCGVRDGLELVY